VVDGVECGRTTGVGEPPREEADVAFILPSCVRRATVGVELNEEAIAAVRREMTTTN